MVCVTPGQYVHLPRSTHECYRSVRTAAVKAMTSGADEEFELDDDEEIEEADITPNITVRLFMNYKK